MPRRSTRLPPAAALLLLLTACREAAAPQGASPTATAPAATAPTSADGTPAPSRPGAVATPSVPGPAPQRVVEEDGGSRRFGDGRAVLASFDPATDRTVVATTIGLAVQTADGEPSTLTSDVATMLATSPDGRLAAITTTSGHLAIWDVEAEGLVTSFDVGADRFTTLAFADGTSVLAGSDAEVVRFDADGSSTALLTAPGGTSLGTVVLDAAGAAAVPILTPAPTIATWTADGTRADIDLGLPSGTRLTGVRWSPDGAHLAVLHAEPGAGDRVGIWDVRAGRFAAHVALPNYVTPAQVAFPAPDRLVLPNLDRVVAYDLTGTEVDAFPAGSSAVAAIDASGGSVVVGRLDGTLTRWEPGAAPAELGDRTVALVDQRGGPAVTVVDQVGLVRAYGADGTERRRIDRWAVGEATAVDLAADGAVLVATSTGAVRLLDAADGTVTAVLDRPQGDVSDVSIAPGEQLVATGVSVQRRVEAWDDTVEVTELDRASGAGTAAFVLGGEAEDVTGCSFYEANVVFSPDGSLLASTSHDYTVQVSPVGDADATTILEPHLGSVLDVDFSPDGTTLVTSADDSTMRLWDVAGWRLREELPTAPGGWFAMAFSPDGSMLAASDVGGRISLLDPATGTVERAFSGARAALGDMVFTPDGQRLLAPRADGSVGIWSVASGALVAELRGHTLPVNGIALSDDGTTLATASQDGTVRTWAVPTA